MVIIERGEIQGRCSATPVRTKPLIIQFLSFLSFFLSFLPRYPLRAAFPIIIVIVSLGAWKIGNRKCYVPSFFRAFRFENCEYRGYYPISRSGLFISRNLFLRTRRDVAMRSFPLPLPSFFCLLSLDNCIVNYRAIFEIGIILFSVCFYG